MSKHTEGPWKVESHGEREKRRALYVKGGLEGSIYNLAAKVGYVGDAEDEANANLIAAAPDMLKALEEIYENARDRSETRDEDGDEYDEWVSVHVAIHKAKGGA